MDWLRDAKCLEEDPELFFPVGRTGPAISQTEVARAVCLACPVRPTCLEWALESGQDYGVWGGLSEEERRSIRRARRRQERERASRREEQERGRVALAG